MKNLEIIKSFCETAIMNYDKKIEELHASDPEINYLNSKSSIYEEIIGEIEAELEDPEMDYEDFMKYQEFFYKQLESRLERFIALMKTQKKLTYNGDKVYYDDAISRFHISDLEEDNVIFREYDIEISFSQSACGYNYDYSFSAPIELVTAENEEKYFSELEQEILKNNESIDKKLNLTKKASDQRATENELKQLHKLAAKHGKTIEEK